MPTDSAQQFLRDLDKKLWSAADRLRANLDAAVYKHAVLHAKDILGHVYEPSGARQTAEGSPQGERGGVHQYFLGQFALAEGKKGGQYFTPKSIVSLIVEMLEPYQGRVYDPAMGSGGFFVQSEKFVAEHGGKIEDVMIFGQESNPTTWRLAAMNMAIRGIDFAFGKDAARPSSSTPASSAP